MFSLRMDKVESIACLNSSMRKGQAPEAKARPLAIVPEAVRRQEEIDRAMADIKKLRKRTGKVTLQEIRSARDAGRRY